MLGVQFINCVVTVLSCLSPDSSLLERACCLLGPFIVTFCNNFMTFEWCLQSGNSWSICSAWREGADLTCSDVLHSMPPLYSGNRGPFQSYMISSLSCMQSGWNQSRELLRMRACMWALSEWMHPFTDDVLYQVYSNWGHPRQPTILPVLCMLPSGAVEVDKGSLHTQRPIKGNYTVHVHNS
jgi:hypothetical protein